MPYRLTVKNGDTKYTMNPKTSAYETAYVDYKVDPEDLGDALIQFLEWANDPGQEDKVTLSFTPEKQKKSKKKGSK